MENNQYVTQEQFNQVLDLVEVLNDKINLLNEKINISLINNKPINGVSVAEFIEKDLEKRKVFGIY